MDLGYGWNVYNKVLEVDATDNFRCGTEDVHCIDSEPKFTKTSCKVGFGGCTIVPSPVCGKGSGTASKGCHVGYGQGWNSRERACDKVPPRLINTRGLTHLSYSFDFFDPTTFEMPMNEADVPLYGEFTALKRNGLQTWIAVGGVKFPKVNMGCYYKLET